MESNFYDLDNLVVIRRYDDGSMNCRVMPVERLANLYGFSDCSGESHFRVYGMDSCGALHELYAYGSYKAPFNRMVLENSMGDIIGTWEWPEH